MGHIVGSSIKDQFYDVYFDYDSVITEEGGLCSNLLNRCGLPNYVGGNFGNFDDDSAASFLEYVGYKRIDLKETIDNSYDEEVTKTHDVWKKDGGYSGEIDSNNNITLRETGHYVTEKYICGNSCGSGQPDHGGLRKVLPPYAGITGPRVSGGRLCQIHRRKGQLIEPAGDTALCIHIARRLTGPHSDAHDGAGTEGRFCHSWAA